MGVLIPVIILFGHLGQGGANQKKIIFQPLAGARNVLINAGRNVYNCGMQAG